MPAFPIKEQRKKNPTSQVRVQDDETSLQTVPKNNVGVQTSSTLQPVMCLFGKIVLVLEVLSYQTKCVENQECDSPSSSASWCILYDTIQKKLYL